jgi:lipopolysaccharide transport system permease protein
VFSLVFGQLLRVPTGDVPYPLFVLIGLVPWIYFANSLNRAGMSLVTSAHMITKVYFPRVLVPVAGIANGLADVLVSLAILVAVTFAFGTIPAPTILFLPILLVYVVALTLGVGLWMAALNVQYRDVTHLLPFLIQIWMYASPIVYPTSIIPERWQSIYALNPVVIAVEGFRWSITGHGALSSSMVFTSVAITLTVLITGLAFFRRVERSFADNV